jgi:hypothetical protein
VRLSHRRRRDIARGRLHATSPPRRPWSPLIVRPALEHAVAACPPSIAVAAPRRSDALLDVWTHLWREHRERAARDAALARDAARRSRGAARSADGRVLPVFAGARRAWGAARRRSGARGADPRPPGGAPARAVREGPEAAARFKDAMHGLLLRC